MRKQSRIKRTREERCLTAVTHVVLLLFCLTILYPFLNIIAKAFSGYTPNTTGGVYLLPVEPQAGTMGRVIMNPQFFTSFLVSLRVAVFGTALSLLVSGMAAYVLSREKLRGRSLLTAVFVFTMMFSGGMIPNYLLVRSVGLLNTVFSLFVPKAVSVYNMLILKSAFEGVPPALEESAKIDGASNLTIFWKIMLPIVIPSLAAVSLFLAVGYWNEYFSAMLYVTKNELKPIQLYLFDMINFAADPLQGTDSTFLFQDAPEGVKAATIIASTLPILAVYPFVQKYFVKGVMIGSVKE